MKHYATSRFWEGYHQLPEHIQNLADQCFALFKANPRHPSLHFKRVGKFWSARVGLDYRALAVVRDGDIYWVWIGPHGVYDKLIA